MTAVTARRPNWTDFLFWLFCYLLLWWVLGGADGMVFGAFCAALASGLHGHLRLRRPRVRVGALAPLVGYFLGKALQGGWDVSRRVLAPRLVVSPAWATYTLASPNPQVHLVLAALVGLLPGTLCARIEGAQLHLHLLDETLAWRGAVTRLEQLLERLIGAHPPC